MNPLLGDVELRGERVRTPLQIVQHVDARDEGQLGLRALCRLPPAANEQQHEQHAHGPIRPRRVGLCCSAFGADQPFVPGGLPVPGEVGGRGRGTGGGPATSAGLVAPPARCAIAAMSTPSICLICSAVTAALTAKLLPFAARSRSITVTLSTCMSPTVFIIVATSA